jgi:hypothetical protein
MRLRVVADSCGSVGAAVDALAASPSASLSPVASCEYPAARW